MQVFEPFKGAGRSCFQTGEQNREKKYHEMEINS